MSITAVVENNSIKLPANLQVPDGTRAEITLVAEVAKEGQSIPKRFAWMEEFAGCIDTLPPDAAARHNEVAHGRKRRLDP